MNILAISDWYGDKEKKKLQIATEAGGVDVIVTLGDLYTGVFKDVAAHFPDTPKLSVMGNHDTRFHPGHAEAVGFQILGSKTTAVNETISGFDGCMRYKDGDGFFWTEGEAMAQLAVMPPSDILLAHSHPYSLTPPNATAAHIGFKALDWYIEMHEPRLMLCGHLHSHQQRDKENTTIIVVYGLQLIAY